MITNRIATGRRLSAALRSEVVSSDDTAIDTSTGSGLIAEKAKRLQKLADIRGVSLEAIAEVTTTNFFRLFSKAKL